MMCIVAIGGTGVSVLKNIVMMSQKQIKNIPYGLIIDYDDSNKNYYKKQVMNAINLVMICNIKIVLQEKVNVKRNLARGQLFQQVTERVENVATGSFLSGKIGQGKFNSFTTAPPSRAEPALAGEFRKPVSEAQSHHMRGAYPMTGEFRREPEAQIALCGSIASTSSMDSRASYRKVTKQKARKGERMGSHELATAREKDALNENEMELPGELSGEGDREPPVQAAPRHRLQLDFSPEAYTQLTEMREATGAKTNAEVVRNALRLYEWYLEQRRKGYRLQLVKDDLIKEVEILL